MIGDYILASNIKTKETVLELWGASTKHADSIFHFESFNKNDLLEDENNLYQFILECASKLFLPVHARGLVNFANDIYDSNYDALMHAYKKKVIQ